MTQDTPRTWTPLDIAGVFILVITVYWFLNTVAGRLDYPYDLEWMEGGMLIHALRIQEGQGLYVIPTADFIPYIYPPLYPWLLAFLGDVVGLDYWLGRSVSVFGTLLALTSIIVGLRKEAVSWGISSLAGALFLSTYDDVGTFLDLTRADALMMGLMGWSIVFSRQRILWAAGLLCWLAFLAKHNAAIIGVPIALWLWRDYGARQAWTFGAWSALPALLSIGWLQFSTEGLFLTYLLDVPAHHPIVGYRFAWLSELEMATAVAIPLLVWMGWYGTSLWTRSRIRSIGWWIVLIGAIALSQTDINSFPKIAGSSKNGVIPFAVVLWVIALVVHCSRESLRGLIQSKPDSKSDGFWLWMSVTLLFFSALMRGHHGGFTNVLMPGLWVLCVTIPLGLYNSKLPHWLVVVLMMTQIYIGRWDVKGLTPTDADRAAGDDLVEMLSKEEGPVWAPHSPWLPVQAGHPATTHLIALWDIDHKQGPLVSYVEDIEHDVSTHRWPVVLSADKRLGFGVREHYRLRKTVRPSRNAFKPKVGWKVRPSYLYRPNKTTSASEGDSVPDTRQQ